MDKIVEKPHLKPAVSKAEPAKFETDAKTAPALDNSKITVIFVLGGPGAGMRWQLTQFQVYSSSPA